MIRKPNSGQALALTAVSLVALVGFAGLAIDMGVLRYEKHLQQTAADAAAIAGAYELKDPTNTGTAVILAGQNASAQNGFTDNQVGGGTNGNISTCTGYSKNAPVTSSTVLPVCVEINNPPLLGPHKGDKNYVETYVAANHPTYFMKIFGITNEPVVARAVATLVTASGTSSLCAVATDQSTTHGIGGVKANGTPTVNATSCGMYDDGAWTTDGSTVSVCAGYVGYYGKDNNNPSTSTSTTSSGSNCAAPTPMPTPVTDPLVQDQQSPLLSPGTPTAFNPSNAVPGTYTNIDITAGESVNFQPGTYYVDNGFTINGGASVNGQGVTFVIEGGSVTINGNSTIGTSTTASTVTLSAPTSSYQGFQPGILFYQVPSDTNAAKILGSNTSYFQGALYFPSALLTFGGANGSTSTNSGANYTLLDASDLQFSGTATINLKSDYAAVPNLIPPVENAILVE